MKFSNGYWLRKEHVSAIFARQIHEVVSSADGHSMDILVPCAYLNDRADSVNLPAFNVHVSSPAEGVIRVHASHWKGARCDEGFPFEDEDYESGAVASCDGRTVFSSGPMSLEVCDGAAWGMRFCVDGTVIAQMAEKSLARYALDAQASVSSSPAGDEFSPSLSGLAKDESDAFTAVGLSINPDETIYGFGERFGPFVKNGQSIDIWNMDGGTASDQAYKNVPFYLSSAGYGILVNQRGHVSFEVGSENTNEVQFSVPGESVDFLVFYGPTPKRILDRYTRLLGRPAIVPAWSYGLWLTTSFTTEYDDQTVNEMVKGMFDRGIPLSAFHYDCFWMRQFHWTDFTWDSEKFKDPRETLARLHNDRKLHVCAWINPYIAQNGSMFDEGRDRGYLVRRPDGEIWQTDLWQAGMGLVDFTNPDAYRWFQGKVRDLVHMGIDAIKTDFGERIPTDVVWFDGSDPQIMHNWYTQLYNQAVFEVLEQERGAGNAVLYARSATAGGQKQPIHWGGDCESTFESMAESLRGGLSLASSGFGYWSHDIGGFEGEHPDSAVYKRWVAFGLLSSHSRMHGSKAYRVPWLFDEVDRDKGLSVPDNESAVAVARKFTHLKLDLLPYLYAAGVEAHEFGTPVMRPMYMEFPDDLNARNLHQQYMLGPSLLVAPVFTYSGDVSYYLPAGCWTNWFSGEQVSSETGIWRHERHAFDSIPLWIRDGSLIVTSRNHDSPEYEYGRDPIIIVSFSRLHTEESLSAVVTESDGGKVTFTATRDSDGVRLRSSDSRDFTARDVLGQERRSHGGELVL
ncbi:alpha-xylosidase [Bifidobacterium sp.]|uniref:alpha-xylosidase n=1 Tax=Bifidobacterium sp. TaxID=41200 RepID=UPI0039E8D4D8